MHVALACQAGATLLRMKLRISASLFAEGPGYLLQANGDVVAAQDAPDVALVPERGNRQLTTSAWSVIQLGLMSGASRMLLLLRIGDVATA